KFKKIKNPLSLIQLEKIVLDFNKISHHSLSLTGGEPLLQADFLKNFLPKIKKRKIKIYLETNGIYYKNLMKILPWIDIISMDIKLPSVSGESFLKEHYDFLTSAYLKELFIKIVVNSKLSLKELETAGGIIKKVNPEILVFIQPDCKEKLNIKELNIFYNILTKFVKEVRIVPQMHKFLKIN
ncbi:MAG: 4Fe-4S cluster-binding domain-containing protein, partial [Armatimonadetes bacterium]|nr:4Fe-4S cluster-binding domain-containing protein [Armatimonadota bacterium]